MLKGLIESEMNILCTESLSKTHNDILLEPLNEYNEDLTDKLYYGAFSVRGNKILFGFEYNFKVAGEYDSNAEAIKIWERKVGASERQAATNLNRDGEDYVIIPIRIDIKSSCRDFYFVRMAKADFRFFFSMDNVEDIYDKYPLLMNILKFYITWIKASDLMGPDSIRDELFMVEDYQARQYDLDKLFMVQALFEEKAYPMLNTISNIAMWNYEGQGNNGFLELAYSTDGIDIMDISFKKANTLLFINRDARAIRKMLELSSATYPLVISSSYGAIIMDGTPNDYYWTIRGLRKFKECNDHIEFMGNGSWKLFCGREIVIYDGITYHFYQRFELEERYDKTIRKYYDICNENGLDVADVKIDCILKIIKSAKKQLHGTMVIISENAEEEANRLCDCGRGIVIDPIDFNNFEDGDNIIMNLTKIDGAMIIGENGICYAIGVIVDGMACENSNPGRGARYNSGYTYVYSQIKQKTRVIAVVISEDGTVDTIC